MVLTWGAGVKWWKEIFLFHATYFRSHSAHQLDCQGFAVHWALKLNSWKLVIVFFFLFADSSVTMRSLQLARLRAAHIWISVALVGLSLHNSMLYFPPRESDLIVLRVPALLTPAVFGQLGSKVLETAACSHFTSSTELDRFATFPLCFFLLIFEKLNFGFFKLSQPVCTLVLWEQR